MKMKSKLHPSSKPAPATLGASTSPTPAPGVLKDGSKALPQKSALMGLVKSNKTINDYSKSTPTIADYPTQDQG